MAHIEEALTTKLLATTGLTALIDRRFSFEPMPQSTKRPYVAASMVSNNPLHALDGQITLESPMYQLVTYADTRAGCIAVMDQIRAALSDYVGTVDGVVIQYIQLQFEDLTVYQEDTTVHVGTLEYQVNYDKE